MLIHLLRVENLKGVKFLEIEPEDNIIVIAGNNGAGKTSALDAISWGMSGGDNIEAKIPIREGENEARVVIELDEIIVKRIWNEKSKNGYLTVTNKEGIKFDSPQTMLNKLIGKISFDPLAFSRMKEKEQRELLLDLLNIKEQLLELDSKKLLAYEERTIINRKVKELEIQIKNAPLPREELPDKEISLSELSAKLKNSVDNNNIMDRLNSDIFNKKERVIELQEEIKKLDREIGDNDLKLRDMKEINISEIEKEIAKAESINNEIRQREEYLELSNQLKDVVGKSDKKTAVIESVEKEKLAILKNSKKPIDGLEVNDEYVSYNKIPFVQLSSAEQLKVSLAIAMETNPTLKVIRITDGSLLDDANMDFIDKEAKEKKYQIFIERVSIDKFADIVMVEGEGAKVKSKVTA